MAINILSKFDASFRIKSFICREIPFFLHNLNQHNMIKMLKDHSLTLKVFFFQVRIDASWVGEHCHNALKDGGSSK